MQAVTGKSPTSAGSDFRRSVEYEYGVVVVVRGVSSWRREAAGW